MSQHKDNSQVLHWPGTVFSAEDLRRHLEGQRELVLLPRALLTPLALDELRAKGVRITRGEILANQGAQPAVDGGSRRWGYHQEQPDAAVAAAVAALAREGKPLAPLDLAGGLRA